MLCYHSGSYLISSSVVGLRTLASKLRDVNMKSEFLQLLLHNLRRCWSRVSDSDCIGDDGLCAL